MLEPTETLGLLAELFAECTHAQRALFALGDQAQLLACAAVDVLVALADLAHDLLERVLGLDALHGGAAVGGERILYSAECEHLGRLQPLDRGATHLVGQPLDGDLLEDARVIDVRQLRDPRIEAHTVRCELGRLGPAQKVPIACGGDLAHAGVGVFGEDEAKMGQPDQSAGGLAPNRRVFMIAGAFGQNLLVFLLVCILSFFLEKALE